MADYLHSIKVIRPPFVYIVAAHWGFLFYPFLFDKVEAVKGSLQVLNWHRQQEKSGQVVCTASHSLGHSGSLTCDLSLQDHSWLCFHLLFHTADFLNCCHF